MGNKRPNVSKVLKTTDKKVKTVLAKADNLLNNKQGTTRDKKTKQPLQDQYKVIREDLLKLREDISHGYDMAKGYLEKSGFFRQLLKNK